MDDRTRSPEGPSGAAPSSARYGMPVCAAGPNAYWFDSAVSRAENLGLSLTSRIVVGANGKPERLHCSYFESDCEPHFCTPNGLPLSGGNCRRVCRPILHDCGDPLHRLHGTRRGSRRPRHEQEFAEHPRRKTDNRQHHSPPTGHDGVRRDGNNGNGRDHGRIPRDRSSLSGPRTHSGHQEEERCQHRGHHVSDSHIWSSRAREGRQASPCADDTRDDRDCTARNDDAKPLRYSHSCFPCRVRRTWYSFAASRLRAFFASSGGAWKLGWLSAPGSWKNPAPSRRFHGSNC